MEIKQEVIFDCGTTDGCFSVRKQKYMEIDGQRVDVGQPERRAFCPGEFEELQEYAPELYSTFETLWTQEVITAWSEKAVPLTE